MGIHSHKLDYKVTTVKGIYNKYNLQFNINYY